LCKTDEDRRTFLRTLGEACERAGFRVHSYVLMTNHYHLLLETPEANLSRGIGGLQNAFTRRINTRFGSGGMCSESATNRFWWSGKTVSGRCLITPISIGCAPVWSMQEMKLLGAGATAPWRNRSRPKNNKPTLNTKTSDTSGEIGADRRKQTHPKHKTSDTFLAL
jgi:Transposase IS200 like